MMNDQKDPEKLNLSAVIITLNVEQSIARCLQSVTFANEIIVVDSGSTDKTCEIARTFGARVIHQDWLGYGAQKQYAVEQASHDWVLCLDADEWVSKDLSAAIQSELQKPQNQAYRFPRCNRFLGRWLRHGEGYPDYNLRLYNRQSAAWTQDPVHEHVVTDVEVGRLDGDLMHESEEGLERYLQKQNRYTTLQAQVLFEQGRQASLSKLLFSPVIRFIKFYIIRSGWRDGVPGLIHISIGCINTFIKNAKLIGMQHR